MTFPEYLNKEFLQTSWSRFCWVQSIPALSNSTNCSNRRRSNIQERNSYKDLYMTKMAAVLGGVSGNAGLFSNANDLAKVMQMYLQLGYYGGNAVHISRKRSKEFTKVQFPQSFKPPCTRIRQAKPRY